jgi:exosortase
LTDRAKILARPWLLYVLWVAFCGLLFHKPLARLVLYSFENDNASHILLIPLLVGWLLYLDRTKVSQNCVLDLRAALLFAVPAVILALVSQRPWPLRAPTGLLVPVLSLILFLIAGFIAIFGRRSSQESWFSLAFLGFAIPWPESLLDGFIYSLQYASAAVAGWIFDGSGVPVLREGFVFHLPGLSIEVAKECSGIRSSMALLILAVLVAHFAFRRFWKKVVFVLAGLLMMAVKNGVRIATLTILAKYVDPGFLFGRLHHQGGVVFFLLGLALLLPVYWWLRRGEKEAPTPATATTITPA